MKRFGRMRMKIWRRELKVAGGGAGDGAADDSSKLDFSLTIFKWIPHYHHRHSDGDSAKAEHENQASRRQFIEYHYKRHHQNDKSLFYNFRGFQHLFIFAHFPLFVCETVSKSSPAAH